MAHALRRASHSGRLHPSTWVRFVFGPASRGDCAAPVVHRHDDFELASEQELAGFEIETDAAGHHYAVRREDLPEEQV